ncbi:MAG: T9SS type A sorting domain-containing protein, partial [Saprospiraceae bacterium]|nr:T9SS type A sorting domain-containing protein [Saprospiraceae bacterium]
FSAPGAYEVCLTVSNTYGSDTKCKTVWVLATSLTPRPPLQRRGGVILWPNPTTGLVFFSTIEGEAMAEVYNQLGQLQLRQNLTDARLDLGLLPNGVYVVRLLREGQAPVTRSVVLNKN